ncbi:hypothetical protein FRC03_011329 [Tulasnella sp. 419]|nr:hypothetical protein FRC03_011329 [Tulasnella sp. 419]
MPSEHPKLNRQRAIGKWDEELSRLNDSVDAYVSHCSDVLFPLLQEDPRLTNERVNPLSDMSIDHALVYIDEKLGSLTRLEDNLKRARVTLQSYRNMSVTLAPINRLPPEILSYVIVIGQRQEEEEVKEYEARFEAEGVAEDELDEEETPKELIDYAKRKEDEASFAILFSWVCSKWRKVAISTATLWSNIDFRGGPPYEYAQEYIRRSKASVLSVFIDSRHETSEISDPENLDKALELLSTEVPRVKSLVVILPTLQEVMKVLKTFSQSPNPPPLEQLQLTTDEDPDGSVIDGGELAAKPLYYKQLMEGIRHIELDNVYLPWNSTTFGNLSSLRLANLSNDEITPSVDQLHSILTWSPGLETLVLENLEITLETGQRPPTPVVLPSLSALTVSGISEGADLLVLAMLIAPNLIRLTLQDLPIGNGTDLLLSTFVKGLQTTSIPNSDSVTESRMEYLRLSNCNFEEVVIERMLVSLPNLVDVGFDSIFGVTDSLFSPLIISDQEEVAVSNACKRLEVLRIESCAHFNTAEVLKKVVKSRKEKAGGSGVRELKRLVIRWCTVENEAENIEWFKEHVEKVIWEESEDEDEDEDEEEDEEVIEIE